MVAGNAINSNGTDGVLIDNGATGNWIGVNPVDGSQNALQRNVISGNANDGVEISGTGTTGNVVAGDYIGTDPTGTQAVPNYVGVEIDGGASGNLIGTNGDGVDDALERNVISGNPFAGVWITGLGTDDNVVAGNYIGTDVTGTIAVGNGSAVQYDSIFAQLAGGVVINSGATDNLIGTSGQSADDAGERNVISGNTYGGVEIEGSGTGGNVVAGDFIGINAAGTAALANGITVAGALPHGDGVFIAEVNSVNWVGVNPVYGPENADEGNVISGNANHGIAFYDCTAGVAAGNLIGTNAAGTAAIPNWLGVDVGDSSSILVGTSGQDGAADDALERNVISGNSLWGVSLDTGILQNPVTTGNVIAGNYIGTNASGTAALGNGTYGVEILAGASNNWIGVNPVYGPESADQRNVISGNDGSGVVINGGSSNVVAGNYIGTTASGSTALGNRGEGVDIFAGTANWIGVNPLDGSESSDQRNIVSANSGTGIYVTGSGSNGNVIAGDYIGTNAAGSAALANGSNGVLIAAGASGNWIGVNSVDGPENADQGNVISGNKADGVDLINTGTTNNVVAGNYVGTNATGTSAIANGFFGVYVNDGTQNNVIGLPGTATSSRGISGMASRSAGRARRATSWRATPSAPMPPAPRRWPIRATGSPSLTAPPTTRSAAPPPEHATSSPATWAAASCSMAAM